MSIAAMSKVWLLNLPAPMKLVLLCLADHCYKDSETAYPSVQRVANLTGLSRRQVQRHLRVLQTSGLIEPTVGARGHRAVTYRLHLDVTPTSSRRSDTDVTPAARQICHPRRLGVTPTPSGGDIRVTRTGKNRVNQGVGDAADASPVPTSSGLSSGLTIPVDWVEDAARRKLPRAMTRVEVTVDTAIELLQAFGVLNEREADFWRSEDCGIQPLQDLLNAFEHGFIQDNLTPLASNPGDAVAQEPERESPEEPIRPSVLCEVPDDNGK